MAAGNDLGGRGLGDLASRSGNRCTEGKYYVISGIRSWLRGRGVKEIEEIMGKAAENGCSLGGDRVDCFDIVP
jgi:hypothetical protein